MLLLAVLVLIAQTGTSQEIISFTVMMQEGVLPPLITQIAKKGTQTAVLLPPQQGTPESRLIIDEQKQVITLLVKEGSVKSGYTLPYHMASLLTMMMSKNSAGQPMLEQARAVSDDVQFAPNGERKTIEGKRCNGYTATWQEQQINLWTTGEMPITWQEMLSPLHGPLQSAGLAGLTQLNGIEGFPMLLEYAAQDGSASRTIRVKDVSEMDRPDMFDTRGYQIIEMK